MLDQHAHEPLQRAERCAMDHHRPMRLVVGADVFQGEAFGAGQIVIELHRAQLPFAAEAVGDQKIGLGAIEGGFAARDREIGNHGPR